MADKKIIIAILKGVPELDQAAIDAAKKLKYRPVKQRGKPVGAWYYL